MVLDRSVRHQRMTEDCEVCCRPIDVEYVVIAGEITEFQSEQT